MKIKIQDYTILVDDEDASKMKAYSWFVRKAIKLHGDKAKLNEVPNV
jgi:hypothetical protein